MERKKVVVVGANSFLARNLVAEFRRDLFELTLYARNPTGNNPDLAFEIFDHPRKPLDFKKLAKADVILYAAGAGVQAALKEPTDLIYQLNAYIPISLLNYLQEKNFKGKIITFGSYFELGNKAAARAYSEEEVKSIGTLVPNHYCSSKRLLTRFISNGLLAVNYYHLILPTIYGPGENNSRLIPYVVNQLHNGLPLTLTSGEQSRAYLYVKELCQLVGEIIISHFIPGIYNVGAAEQLPVKELVAKLGHKMNRSLTYTGNQAVRTDVAMQHLELNPEKLYKTTSWRPRNYITDIIHLYQKDIIT